MRTYLGRDYQVPIQCPAHSKQIFSFTLYKGETTSAPSRRATRPFYVPHRTSSIQGRHTPRGDDGKKEGRLSKVKMTDLVMVISSHFISDLSFLPRRELLLPFVLWSSSRREFREIRPNCIARRRRALIKTPSCCPSDEFHSS